MPQLNKESMQKIAAEPSHSGYQVTYKKVPPASLTPVQNELNSKVILKYSLFAQKGQFDPCNDYILVSHDSDERKLYIIDGHHRAISCLLTGGEQNTIIVDVKPIALLDILNAHPDVTRDRTFLREFSHQSSVSVTT